MIERQEIIDKLKTLSLSEAVELVQQIELTFDVSTTIQPTAQSIELTGQNDQITDIVDQTEFTVILESVPDENQKSKRLSIFRLIRELTSVGLKEAKEMTSNLPQTIKEAISNEQSNEIKTQFEELGAKIKII